MRAIKLIVITDTIFGSLKVRMTKQLTSTLNTDMQTEPLQPHTIITNGLTGRIGWTDLPPQLRIRMWKHDNCIGTLDLHVALSGGVLAKCLLTKLVVLIVTTVHHHLVFRKRHLSFHHASLRSLDSGIYTVRLKRRICRARGQNIYRNLRVPSKSFA